MTYDELDRRCTRLSQINYGYRKQADAMRVYIVELEAALKFYAHRGHWMTDGLGSEPVSHIDLDGGDIARKALEE